MVIVVIVFASSLPIIRFDENGTERYRKNAMPILVNSFFGQDCLAGPSEVCLIFIFGIKVRILLTLLSLLIKHECQPFRLGLMVE